MTEDESTLIVSQIVSDLHLGTMAAPDVAVDHLHRAVTAIIDHASLGGCSITAQQCQAVQQSIANAEPYLVAGSDEPMTRNLIVTVRGLHFLTRHWADRLGAPHPVEDILLEANMLGQILQAYLLARRITEDLVRRRGTMTAEQILQFNIAVHASAEGFTRYPMPDWPVLTNEPLQNGMVN